MSTLAIGKHRKQTWMASSQLDMAQTRQTPVPPVLWCQTSWAIQILDSVATQTRAHHDNLHSWWWQREQYHLGLIQSPLKGTICARMWFTRDLSCWRVCWQCCSFSVDCVSVCVYNRQQTTEALTVPSVFSNLQEHLQGWRQPPNQQHSIIKTIYNTQGCTQLINSKVKPRIKTKIWLFLTWLFLILVCLNLYKPNPDSVTPLQEHTKFVLKINK